MRRERLLLDGRLGIASGDVLSVGCGWYPGRHLFPAPEFRLVAVDSNPECVVSVVNTGQADEAQVGYAGRLGLPPASFDVVLYRLALHHIAYQGPLAPCFAEAADLLRPGGAMVAVEPGLWHPVGLGLALANRAGAATAIHGTPDDIPLSPRQLLYQARAAGLVPELHAVTFGWRRLPPSVQRGLTPPRHARLEAARGTVRAHADADRPEETLTPALDLERGVVAVCIRPGGDEQLRSRTLASVRANTASEVPVLLIEPGEDPFARTARADVVLLEPGCVVAAGWLDGLRRAAFAGGTTATAAAVTQRDLDPRLRLDAERFEEAAAEVRSRSPRLRPDSSIMRPRASTYAAARSSWPAGARLSCGAASRPGSCMCSPTTCSCWTHASLPTDRRHSMMGGGRWRGASVRRDVRSAGCLP